MEHEKTLNIQGYSSGIKWPLVASMALVARILCTEEEGSRGLKPKTKGGRKKDSLADFICSGMNKKSNVQMNVRL